MNQLDQQLKELTSMPPAQLRALWRDCWRRPAPDIAPDLLRRGIAWKLQSRVHGTLPADAKRKLDAATKRLRQGEPINAGQAISLKPGTRLVRSWGGKVHQVLVFEDGFEHEGRRFTSLTQVATAITSVHCSGPKFFGLKRRHTLKPRGSG